MQWYDPRTCNVYSSCANDKSIWGYIKMFNNIKPEQKRDWGFYLYLLICLGSGVPQEIA